MGASSGYVRSSFLIWALYGIWPPSFSGVHIHVKLVFLNFKNKARFGVVFPVSQSSLLYCCFSGCSKAWWWQPWTMGLSTRFSISLDFPLTLWPSLVQCWRHCLLLLLCVESVLWLVWALASPTNSYKNHTLQLHRHKQRHIVIQYKHFLQANFSFWF